MRTVPWIVCIQKGGLAKEIKNLPFQINMFGQVRAIVLAPDDPRLKPQKKELGMPRGPYSTV